MAKRRDWIFRSVLACCVLVLSLAFLSFSQFLISSFFPGSLRFAQSSQLPWLQGFDAVVLGAFLLILAFLLYIAARQRAISNDQLRPSAGCPSCQQSSLVRISRSSSDRLFGYSYIPMGRFTCSNCRWEGRRVIRKGNGSKKRTNLPATTALMAAMPPNKMDSIFDPVEKTEELKEEADAKPAAEAGAAAVVVQEISTEPGPADESDMAGRFPAGSGYQLTDKWSNHVISVHAQADSDCADLGEVVGTLHVQIWQLPGSETTLQACLDHITTTVTIYKRTEEAGRSQR